MKKVCLIVSLLAMTCLVLGPGAWAQGDEADQFTLEEITVTAEKRSENLQKIPSSVVALTGDLLLTQSKITTEQILENVPNVTFRTSDGAGNPNGNISIRGIQRPQGMPARGNVLPATTATYVDGVYQGIGGNYDLNRVEVLRGPQGTLYGRSATGGVVSFYTNDPKLGEFGGHVNAEFGSDALVNLQGALNVPAGEKVALRAAGHYYSRDGLFDADGLGKSETKEGRLKVLFQPTDALQIVAAGSKQETVVWGGGNSILLQPGPNDFDYDGPWAEYVEDDPYDYNQFSLNANYDFGDMVLTYVGAYHDYTYTGAGVPQAKGLAVNRFPDQYPKDEYHTEELRLTSDTDGKLKWLVGVNYFTQEWENNMYNIQVSAWGDPLWEENPIEITRVIRAGTGEYENYGAFTEETFELTDDFRITAGLRYDKTKLTQHSRFTQFLEGPYTTPDGNIYVPAGMELDETFYNVIDSSSAPETEKVEWDNITYKLRFEYDVTPDNMVYFVASSGFLPGYASVSGSTKTGEWTIQVLDEQEVVAYEIGTKNQLLDNRLRLNGALFYHDMKGWPENFDLNNTYAGGKPVGVQFALPVTMFGLELDGEFLLTAYDKLSFGLGYLTTDLDESGFPESVTWKDEQVTDGSYVLMLDEIAGHPEWQANLAYDHMFVLGDGSTLVPRAELLYTGSYYTDNLNYFQETNELSGGDKPYLHQDGYALINANVSWTAASQKYSATAWVRNAFDEEYKSRVALGMLNETPGVTPGDPRTFGVMVSAKF